MIGNDDGSRLWVVSERRGRERRDRCWANEGMAEAVINQ